MVLAYAIAPAQGQAFSSSKITCLLRVFKGYLARLRRHGPEIGPSCAQLEIQTEDGMSWAQNSSQSCPHPRRGATDIKNVKEKKLWFGMYVCSKHFKVLWGKWSVLVHIVPSVHLQFEKCYKPARTLIYKGHAGWILMGLLRHVANMGLTWRILNLWGPHGPTILETSKYAPHGTKYGPTSRNVKR